MYTGYMVGESIKLAATYESEHRGNIVFINYILLHFVV